MIKVFQAMFKKGAVPVKRQAQVALRYEPVNLSQSATVASVQSALRQAEAGDTRTLFSLYRDMAASGTHIQAEMAKRKLALLSQPISVIPADRTNADDLKAAEACKALVDGCENWEDGLVHLLDGCLWPVAVAEKVYKASDVPGLRFLLRRLEPVNPTLLCFREPSVYTARAATQGVVIDDRWEPGLRFYATELDGRVNYSADQSYEADPARHVVHRGHLLIGLRDCWGGPMRALVFWWLLGTLGRDWFARGMERWGAPFPVGHTNAKDQQALDLLSNAFALSTKIGGLVVDHETQVELKEIAASGMADAYEKFLNVCNREVSKLIVGQTLSAEAQSTGLGSSVGNLQADVREDIRQWDQVKMGSTVRTQIFEPFLRVNGLRGRAPTPTWGGLETAEAKAFADSLSVLKQSGFEPTDEAVATVSDRMGFPVQRVSPEPRAESLELNKDNGDGTARRLEQKVAKDGDGNNGKTDLNKEVAEDAENGRETKRLTAGLSPEVRARIATLSAQEKMADKLGVPGAWLNPVREFLEELQRKAGDASLSDQDLMDFLDQAVKRVPELFKHMDVDELAEVLEAGMGEAVIQEVRRGLRKDGTAQRQDV